MPSTALSSRSFTPLSSEGGRNGDNEATGGHPSREELRSACSLYSSAVWLEAASDSEASIPADIDVDHLTHAVIHAHNSWSDAFMQMIQATHHH